MNKKIISLMLAAILAVSALFSLSSCMSILEEIVEMSDGDTLGAPQGNLPAGPSNNPSANTGTKPDGNENSDTPEFYPSTQNPDASDEDITNMSRALLSAVSVYASFEIEYGYPSFTTEKSTSRGSGVIYKLDKESGNAYIITNYHVVYNASATSKTSQDIQILLYGQEYETYAIDATYIGGSMANDIAVLKVSDSAVLRNSNAQAVSVADSDTLAVFDKVYVIGNPEALGLSVTEGIVSVESEMLPMTGADGKTTIKPRVIRVSAAINDGNSGGGLFDTAGQLVGIVNAKRTGNSIDNIGYAIPTNVAVRLADSIIYYCDGADKTNPKKAMLGVTISATVCGTVIDEDGRVIKVEIPEIIEIQSGSPIADKLAVGDRINSITVDGLTKATTRSYHIIDMMFFARVGSTVTLSVTRGDQTFEVTVTVTDGMLLEV